MFAELVNDDIKIYKFEYSKAEHSFIVSWGDKNSSAPHTRSVFDGIRFPGHKPFDFLDEKVRVGDEIMIWLKDESALKAEGWEEYRDGRRMRSDKSPFFIGSDKRRLLGTGLKCRIGITEKFQPYAYYRDYRFSPAEVKTVLKLDFVQPIRFAELVTEDGILKLSPQTNEISLPDGHKIPVSWADGITQICKLAGAGV